MTSPPAFSPGLNGTTCAVTGGAHGLGRGIAELFLDMGCTVHALDKDRRALNAWGKETTARGLPLHLHVTDVADPVSVKAAFRKIRALDILVNNAGTPGYQSFDSMKRRDWDRVIRNNLTGVYQCSRQALSKLRRSKQASIVNISSIEAHRSETCVAHYASAKAAIEAFTRSLAVELAVDGIRVNAVAPGAIAVEHNAELYKQPRFRKQCKARIPLGGKPGNASDIAKAVAFLSSPLAGYITGTTLTVDGGWMASL